MGRNFPIRVGHVTVEFRVSGFPFNTGSGQIKSLILLYRVRFGQVKKIEPTVN